MSAKKPGKRRNRTRRKPTDINWPAIKREYAAGQLSLEEIASQHGITKSYVCKMARKYNWPGRGERDVREAIRERTEQLLVTEQSTLDEGIEIAAARGAQVVREHRSELGDLRTVVRTLTAEMLKVLSQKAPGKNASKAQIILFVQARKAVPFNLKTCTDAIAKLIPLERQAFNIDASSTGEDLESLLRKLNSSE